MHTTATELDDFLVDLPKVELHVHLEGSMQPATLLALARKHRIGDVPQSLERIRSWGFNVIKARQLQHNRQEICVAALQTPFRRKS